MDKKTRKVTITIVNMCYGSLTFKDLLNGNLSELSDNIFYILDDVIQIIEKYIRWKKKMVVVNIESIKTPLNVVRQTLLENKYQTIVRGKKLMVSKWSK